MDPPLTRPGRREVGRAAEDIAAAYLRLMGFEILARNVRDGPRELDLVAAEGPLVVVVEVKFRADSRFGGFRAALGSTQQRDLERATVAFLKKTGRTGCAVRFDLVGVELDGPRGLRLLHVPAAFRSTGHYRM